MDTLGNIIIALLGALAGSFVVEFVVRCWQAGPRPNLDDQLEAAERKISYTLPKLM